MKKLLPDKRDLVMFIIGFLPAFIALIYYLSFNYFFILGDLPFIFNMFCYPIVILLVGVLTSKYTSTLFCAGTTFVSWAAVYLIINHLFYGYDMTIFETEDVYNRVFTYALMTLIVLAVRGLVSLIIYATLRIRRKHHPEISEEQSASAGSNALNIVLIILCAADITGFLVSFLFFRGMNKTESVLSLLIAAAAMFGALIMEFPITLLPKSFKFSVRLTIVFNVVFLLLFFVALDVYGFLPFRSYMGGAVTSLLIILFPIVHIASAAISLIIRKAVFESKSKEKPKCSEQ